MKTIFNTLILAFSLLFSPLLLAEMVNINKATAAALQENLKGIGEKKSQAIIAYRKEFGAFKTLDEVMEVKGIGKGIFKKIKADISLDEGVTDLLGNKSKTAVNDKAKKKADKAASKSKKPVAKDQKAVKDSKSAEKVKKS